MQSPTLVIKTGPIFLKTLSLSKLKINKGGVISGMIGYGEHCHYINGISKRLVGRKNKVSFMLSETPVYYYKWYNIKE